MCSVATLASSSSFSPCRVVVMLSGRGSNLAALIKALEKPTASCNSATAAEIVGVVSDQPNAPALELAKTCNIETAVVQRQPKQRSAKEFETELADCVLTFRPNLIVLAGFMRVLTETFIGRCGPRIINIHPSLLPAFKGLDAQQQALDAGVKYSGCTVHIATAELDGGPILDQKIVPVFPGDTRETLATRILEQEHQLLPAVVLKIAQGEIKIDGEPLGPISIAHST